MKQVSRPLSIFLLAGWILIGAVGCVLYLSSYFWGGLLILLGLGLFLYRLYLEKGKDAVKAMIRRGATPLGSRSTE